MSLTKYFFSGQIPEFIGHVGIPKKVHT